MKKTLLPSKWMSVASLSAITATISMSQNTSAADAERGNQFFQTSCALCHSDGLGPGNTVVIKQGPTLVGVMGRNAGTSPHFGFTQALKDSGLVWNAETLDQYLSDPTTAVPGTTMSVTVSDATDRADVIAYLATLIVPEGVDLDKLPRITGLDPDDWQEAVPGAQHFITVADLPPPYATSSAGNFPTVVPRPANASLAVLPGFTVKLFASGLTNPRIVRVAPNGDIFVSETSQNRIRVFRANDGADTPSTNRIFAQGLNRPFGIGFYPAGDDPRWLYVALNNSIVRIPYRNGDLVATGAVEVVVPILSATATRLWHSMAHGTVRPAPATRLSESL